MGASKQVLLRMDNKDVPVWVQQIGKAYRAHGVFLGRHIEGSGPTEIKAVSAWRHNAEQPAKQ
ncbi:hypothetical protein [Caballeronia sordidicola]|uniref:Uncharacterized protein n=1 Tax=Caballeronia sordidicola TaxID=196367 RepID=A0A242MAA8_CABSO|nr:hypothetical protein [Caballeronia sordidicola]OTP68237.1 hypothetical protein PAMC26510_29430 [Caballeronia sordidicola]